MFINIDFLSELFYELSGKSHGVQSFYFSFLHLSSEYDRGCFLDNLYYRLIFQKISRASEIHGETNCTYKAAFNISPTVQETFDKNDFPLTYVLNVRAYCLHLRCRKLR